MINRPPFSGEYPRCVKCGNVGAHTRYAEVPVGGECLTRACRRCDYEWEEATVQQKLPAHVGGNAEDCPACSGSNPSYPFICPGPSTLDSR